MYCTAVPTSEHKHKGENSLRLVKIKREKFQGKLFADVPRMHYLMF
jgi:hypothetical protein